MTDTPKKKNQATNLITYGWNLFLFARTFRAEIDAPPQEVASALEDIQSDYNSTWLHSQNTTVEQISDDVYNLDTRVYGHMSERYKVTSVKGTGRILYSKGYNTTIVQGDIRLGWLNYIVGLVALMFLLGQVFVDIGNIDNVRDGLLFLIALAIPLSIGIGSLYRDYRRLTKDLQNTLLTLQERSGTQDNAPIHDDYSASVEPFQQAEATQQRN